MQKRSKGRTNKKEREVMAVLPRLIDPSSFSHSKNAEHQISNLRTTSHHHDEEDKKGEKRTEEGRGCLLWSALDRATESSSFSPSRDVPLLRAYSFSQ